MQAVTKAGGDFAVLVFAWADIEPTPNYLYWERTDAALAAAEFYGVRVFARLDRPPTWAATGDSTVPWSVDAYAAFVGRTVARYGNRLAGVILWNEPNLALEWNGHPPDPTGYVALLQAGYRAAKAAHPELPVLMAGLAFTQGDGAKALNDLDYLRAVYAAGGGAYFDGLAAHPYGFGAPPQQEPSPERLNFRRLELHRQIMHTQGEGAKAVLITEMGWRTNAPDPADAWQVVTPQQQADFTLDALAYAAATYPWLEGMALWELNGQEDLYGYNLWNDPSPVDASSITPIVPAYAALVKRAASHYPPGLAQPARTTLPILAPDVIVRLGDRGDLHPHWVHLYENDDKNGGAASTTWTSEFFLSDAERKELGQGAAALVRLETMQIDQPTNRLWVNNVEIGLLTVRSRPDPTSTWVDQALSVPGDLLRAGVNTVTIAVGLRNPVRQYRDWRWENFQIRNLRLTISSDTDPPVPAAKWTPLPSPSGWAEINRVHRFADGGVWATGNRTGQVWYGPPTNGYDLENQAGNRGERVFVDVLETSHSILAATDRGLLYQRKLDLAPLYEGPTWEEVDAPDAYAYRIALAHFYGQDVYVAGFEKRGVWAAYRPTGPWFPLGLNGLIVLDLAQVGPNLYAATDRGVFRWSTSRPLWQRLPPLPETNPDKEDISVQPFVARIFVGESGELVVRSQDRLWVWQSAAVAGWVAVGPELLQGEAYAVTGCCGPGTLLGTFYAGLWQLSADGLWQRVDVEFFAAHEITGLVQTEDGVIVATATGLFLWSEQAGGHKLGGLPSTVTDLLHHPADMRTWIGATPAGIVASTDRGATWQSISAPWAIWDLARSADGKRLFAARSRGVVWADLPSAGQMIDIVWQEARGMETILFFNVDPSPTDPMELWAGSWGNNVGVSLDRGGMLAPLHNGLETLSVLDVLWHPTSGQMTIATIEGLLRTDNDGASWFKLPGPLQQQTVHALHQTADGVIWAGAADGLWLSRDYGVVWARATGLPPVTVLRLGRTRDFLWAGTEGAGLWWSRDGGTTWASAGLGARTVYALLDEGEWLIAATDAGLWRGE